MIRFSAWNGTLNPQVVFIRFYSGHGSDVTMILDRDCNSMMMRFRTHTIHEYVNYSLESIDIILLILETLTVNAIGSDMVLVDAMDLLRKLREES